MDDEIDAPGLTPNALWTLAWVLGLIAAGCLVRLVVYAAHNSQGRPGLFAWTVLGAITAAFSAASAVLAGIKTAEERIADRLRRAAP